MNARQHWIYKNNRVVVFTDSEEQASDPETPRDDLGSDNKQEEVSQLLESVTQSITAVVGQLSHLQTPVTVPRALPSTPASPLRVQLPTPRATTFQGYASGSHSLTRVPVPQSPLSTYPRVSPSSPLVPPRVPSPQAPVPPLRVSPAPVIAPVGMANPPPTKLLGAAPEPFNGKPEKAEAFWNNLENYFHLNILIFDTDDKKISTALTYFKVGTPAGQWAQDKQKAALNPVGGGAVTFGAWADFKTNFRDHFIPAHTALEATNLMYTLKMGNRTFNDWYQEWSTHATRSGTNDATKMYAFQQAIPGALLGKLMGISPFPMTLATLVEKARDFDRVWRLHAPRNTYSNSPCTPSRQTTSGRAILTEDDSIGINASSSRPEKSKGKLTKEEREFRFKNKLCLYCGKPGHILQECRTKTTAMRTRGGQASNTRTRGVFAEDDDQEEAPSDHPAHIGATYREILPYSPDARPRSTPINADF